MRKILITIITITTLSNLNAQSGGWDGSATNGTTGFNDWGNGVIQLLDYNATGCSGSAVHETSATYDPLTADFNQCYQVYFGCPGNDNIGSDAKGDGMAFSFWKSGLPFNINNGLACGGGLGYMGTVGAVAPNTQMLTIEFDTWSSQGAFGFDAAYGGGTTGTNDEIALHRGGDASDGGRLTSANAGNLEDGLEHAVCINYNRTTFILTVTIDGATRLTYDFTGSPYELAFFFGAGGVNQSWSAGKFGATDMATVSKGASIFANVGGTFNLPTPVVPDQTICSGGSATFDAGGGYASYLWSTNATTQTINVSATNTYSVTVINGAGCSGSDSGILTVNPTSVGGNVTANATVCSGANSGTLTLAGYTGTITDWERSTNGGPFTSLGNVTTSQTYTNLAANTIYRAVVKSGSCPSVNSGTATITVSPPSVGGTVSSSTTVCSGANSGTLTLAGYTGTITDWERSTNGGPFTSTGNLTASQTYTNLAANTIYRAVVKSGSCASVNSSTATITVSPPSVGGTVSSSTTVCSGANSGTLTLAGYTGTITDWERSTNGGPFTSTGNLTASQTYTNLAANTIYRAVVKSGSCASVNSGTATITVSTPSVGGTVSASTAVCSGANSGTLTLSGHTGSVVKWQSSTNGGAPVDITPNTSTTQTYNNLTLPTEYWAVVQSGSCSAVNSISAIITIDPISVGGTVSSDASVCSGSNSGTLTLAGYTGNIIRWESSANGGPFASLPSNTTSSQAYNNLAVTTIYRAVLKSGSCSSVNSGTATITMNNPTSGGTVSASTAVCSGANSGTLTLSGHTGSVVKWQSSTNGGAPVDITPNTSTTQSYNNLTLPTEYWAVVQSGSCPAINSISAIITIDPVSIGGTVSSDAAVCAGSNSNTLTLSGYTGSIVRWESSANGSSFSALPNNTTSSQPYNNLAVTTIYRAVIKSGSCSSVNSGTATITVNEFPVVSISDKTICFGASTTFDAGNAGATYLWSNPGTGTAQTTPASAAGLYSVTVTQNNCSATGSATLFVNAAITPNLISDTIVCVGQSVELNPGTLASLNYSWTPTLETTQTIYVSTAGKYKVTVNDDDNCTGSDSIVIQFNVPPNANLDLGNDATICGNDVNQLTLSVGYTPVNKLYWSTLDNGLSSIVITTPGTYWVKATDANKCSIADTITIAPYCEDIKIEWPNFVTDNYDQINDNFQPIGMDDSNFQKIIANINWISFEVYDRWGILMFSSGVGIMPNWDGKYNGSTAPSGTYYFVVKYKNSANKTYEVANFMTLLH